MKNYFTLSFILLFTSILCASNNPAFEIKLKSGNFTPEVTTNFEETLRAKQVERNQGFVYRLVQFYDIPTSAEKQQINDLGIELMSYIPNKAFIAKIKSNLINSDFEGLNIRSVFDITADFKLSPVLTKKEYPEWAISGKNIKLNLKYYSTSDEVALVNLIVMNKGAILEKPKGTNILVIQYATADIMDLAKHPLVQWIEPISPPSTPNDTGSKNTSRANTLNTQYRGGRKYDGSGVMVGVADDGVVGPHIDFEGRMTNNTTENSGKHGDMCSGIFVGAGNLDPSIGGICPGAEIQIYRIGIYIFLSSQGHILDAVEQYNNIGQVITSTSYSQGLGGEYDVSSEFIDEQLNETPSLMHVFAAGNSGTRDHNYGAGPGWGNISGSMKASKNVICAGNLDQNDNLFFSSSRGPAKDGRIKPDLCAQGEGLMTTDENNTFQPGNGTSAASPAIAGVVAQLYQAYREHNGGLDPETGLLKAALLNTATDLGNPGPDYMHGWGAMNALKAVRIIEDNRYIKESIGQGENKSHTINVPANVSQVKIMTYWADVAGNPNAAIAIVNDINMQVVTPTAIMYNPLVLDPTPDATLLNAPAVQGIDNLNNLEQVTIDNPESGDYTINLDGFAIPQGPQTYFVLYDFIYDEVELTYPIGGEGLVPGETVLVKWDASESSDFFSFEYSEDGGASYSGLGTIASTQRSFSWKVPNIITDQAKFRVSRGNSSSESNANFTIAGVPQNVEIISVCPEYIEIGWDVINGISEYEISMLGDKYMDSIGVSTTNSFIVSGLDPSGDQWFSVRSIVSGAKGRRAIAINKPPGTENCVLNNDIEVTQILSVLDIISTCRDLQSTVIAVKVTNLGLLAASGAIMNYQIDSETIVSQPLSMDLQPGQDTDFVFDTNADFAGLNNGEISIWVSMTNDENLFNDMLTTPYQVFNNTVIDQFPHTENFQSFTQCSIVPDCRDNVCTLGTGWTNLINYEGDDIDWRTDAGGTATSSTGPSGDYDNGTSAGKYLYLEGTNCGNTEAILISPCIDLTEMDEASVEFAYHMYGNAIGELHVDLITDDGEILDIMNPIIGQQGDFWKLLEIDLTPYVGGIINLKISGNIGDQTFSRGDMALDAFTFNASGTTSTTEQEDLTSQINLYPNPTIGNLTIGFPQQLLGEDISIELIDVLGQRILDIQNSRNDKNVSVDISNLVNGVYFLTISGDGFKTVRKLVKH